MYHLINRQQHDVVRVRETYFQVECKVENVRICEIRSAGSGGREQQQQCRSDHRDRRRCLHSQAQCVGWAADAFASNWCNLTVTKSAQPQHAVPGHSFAGSNSPS